MKKTICTLPALLILLSVYGQQKQGKVVYERTTQMEIHIQGLADDMAQSLPRSHKDKLEVLFANDQSLRRAVEDNTPEELAEPEGGMQVHMVMAGAGDIIYTNLATGQIIEGTEFGAKNYIIADSVRHPNWKLTGATTTILNYPCQQAVMQRIGKRSSTTMENGKLETKEVADTADIVVWFTPSIPVSAGPEYQGQLPGLILGIDINNGRTVYTATSLSDQADLTVIKAPSKGKKVTRAEFEKERDKLMGTMQRSHGARAAGTIRIAQ
ncbi:GLPGLI family protein [Chitinophaga polysaccharea]|uniref:GLPGLI family protein n=1 Tax=Chitinophaga polysaccharea TaxID=1293035 RepID=A0A561P760_9BACT|nr:GLPGLI family protein [Chitinophaga polysaccharea]TWF33934.1 GLPGLI family protein [Chitinophaga polysaccharea]